MTEGELKKRIEQMEQHPEFHIWFTEEISEILGEVAKDFPNWDDDVKYRHDWENEKRIEDTFAWFKKWFGEKQP